MGVSNGLGICCPGWTLLETTIEISNVQGFIDLGAQKLTRFL